MAYLLQSYTFFSLSRKISWFPYKIDYNDYIQMEEVSDRDTLQKQNISSKALHPLLYSYLFIMKKITLTDNQKKLIKMYAEKADLEVGFVIKSVEEWVITISEISQGILGKKVK